MRNSEARLCRSLRRRDFGVPRIESYQMKGGLTSHDAGRGEASDPHPGARVVRACGCGCFTLITQLLFNLAFRAALLTLVRLQIRVSFTEIFASKSSSNSPYWKGG